MEGKKEAEEESGETIAETVLTDSLLLLRTTLNWQAFFLFIIIIKNARSYPLKSAVCGVNDSQTIGESIRNLSKCGRILEK